ncbi:nitrogen fixation protein NifQ [Methylicorpusculum sp.]|uniref:nitrogen fixation protein NifQ n=2 Tax=Methylicorpusculum sp. TaxID=2713644 RepID=UPI00272578AE|nr:nitrogen fixation protein NifQ [Methylicorpusculum sp.]MDO8843733.1 nitrogen fixation protein NifQ [Methylicorpusculum sp.]
MATFAMTRERIFRELVERSNRSGNAIWLARMIASWRVGEGALPDYLGLSPEQFNNLRSHCFSDIALPHLAVSGKTVDYSRMLEKQDLETLLGDFRAPDVAETEWIIAILVAGCLGSDHLWQDLGLWSRSELSGLMSHNFPELAARNNKDMKWKKFLYKQLCEMEGLNLCRAPSCQVCQDYGLCFASEESTSVIDQVERNFNRDA